MRSKYLHSHHTKSHFRLLIFAQTGRYLLEMSVEDGLKLIISGGVITPKEQAEENDTSHI